LTLIGAGQSAPAEHFYQSGITIANGAGTNVRLINLRISGNPHCAIKEMGHGGANITIEGCELSDNGSTQQDHGLYLPASNCMVRGNWAHNNTGFGFHLYDHPDSLLVESNLATANGRGGILLSCSNSLIQHNFVFGNGYTGITYYHATCK